jgi:bifunctional oligoribonuclease and PAP phosphatase NrnA
MPNKDIIKQIAELIIASDSFLITVHESADGDAVGSMLALGKVLEMLNKELLLYSPDPIPAKLRFLEGSNKITSNTEEIEDRKFDLMIMLDCGDRQRSGDYISNFRSYKSLINIDHHVSNDAFGNLNLIDPKVSSTAEHVYTIITEIMQAKFPDKKLSKDIASSLLAALYDDTGGMRYISTTSKTLRIAAELVDAGANCADISENLFFSVSREKMELTSRVLASLRFENKGKIAYLIMKLDDLDATGAYSEDSEGLIDFPRAIEGVEVAFLIKEIGPDRYKISFRSRGKVDVNEFCSRFGGGGHKVASGCTICGSLDNVIDKIVLPLKEMLN